MSIPGPGQAMRVAAAGPTSTMPGAVFFTEAVNRSQPAKPRMPSRSKWITGGFTSAGSGWPLIETSCHSFAVSVLTVSVPRTSLFNCFNAPPSNA